MATRRPSLDDLREDSEVLSNLSTLESFVDWAIQDILENPSVEIELRSSTRDKLRDLRRNFKAALYAAYTNPNVDTWNFAETKKSFLWLIAISIVYDSILRDKDQNCWLRFLFSEKVPKQVNFVDLRLFVRTCDFRYFPRQLLSDRAICSLIGSWHKQLEYAIVKLKYFESAKAKSRKKGYTDGKGCKDFSTDPLMFSHEESKDFSANEIQVEIDLLRRKIHEAEEFLSTLGIPGRTYR